MAMMIHRSGDRPVACGVPFDAHAPVTAYGYISQNLLSMQQWVNSVQTTEAYVAKGRSTVL